MKIHIINLFLSRNGGGIFTVVNELYNSKIFKKTVFKDNLYFWGYNDKYSEIDTKELNGISRTFKKTNKFLFSLKFKRELKANISENSIIHLHSLWMYPSVLLLNLNKTKKVISTHGMLDAWALNNSKTKKRISLFLFERKNLNSADCIHALCKQEYNDIRKIAPKVPIAIIPNGINLPIESAINPERNKTLLFLGRVHPKKGLENLIDAWFQLNNNEWKLIIVGPDENDYKEKIKQKIILLNLEGSISLLDSKYGVEKDELFRTVSAFILPSFSEGLPMVILEAWSYKVPVIMTKECNLEIGFEKNAAIEINTSIDSIKLGIEKVINLSEDQLVEIGQAGYDLVKNNYTWDEVGIKMNLVYKWVNKEIEKPSFINLI
jgi:glycosyltransferase involved in cell wall biosynthesis